MEPRGKAHAALAQGRNRRPVATVATTKFAFTRRAIDALPVPAVTTYYRDTMVRGLALRITPADARTFVLYRKVHGRPERINIGPYADLSIEQARGKAEELNSQIALGDNPAHERRALREEMTLQELFDTYIRDHSQRLGKRTWAEDVRRFNLHLHGWGMRKVSEITRYDVARLHGTISRKVGPIAANRTVELLRRVINKGKVWGLALENPAEHIERNREQSRERFLQAEELKPFFTALAQEESEIIRDFILLLLLTGARRGNVQAMRWADINWPAATWRIPETKNGQPLTVTLSPPAITVLERRQLSAGASPWVFPGTGATGHLQEPKKAWANIRARAGLRDLRLHDLRRTLGSWQAATGASLPIIGKSLGHRSVAATAIYARLALDPVRIAVNKATSAMLLAGGQKISVKRSKKFILPGKS